MYKGDIFDPDRPIDWTVMEASNDGISRPASRTVDQISVRCDFHYAVMVEL